MFDFLNENVLREWRGEGLNVEESIISRVDFFNLKYVDEIGNEGTKLHQIFTQLFLRELFII